MNYVTHDHAPSHGRGHRGWTLRWGPMSSKNLSLYFYWPQQNTFRHDLWKGEMGSQGQEVEKRGCQRIHIRPQPTACWGFHCPAPALLPSALITENHCKAAGLPRMGSC